MKILLVIFLIFPTLVFSDSFTDIVSKERIGSMNCTHSIKTQFDNNQRNFEAYCIFDNVKYDYIEDYGNVIWITNSEVEESISGLKKNV